MHDALALLNELDQAQVEWFFNTGHTQRFKAGAPIIREGIDPGALYIVMEGLVGIYVSSVGNSCLATLGPGEMLGDISFLEEIPASASVIAVEESNLLSISRKDLESKLKEDHDFASRIYKTFAIISSKRLRERERTYGRMFESKTVDKLEKTPVWERISGVLGDLKELLQKADREALNRNGLVTDVLAEKIETEFSNFMSHVNEEIGDKSSENIHVKESLGLRLQREILPYLLLTKTAERAYAKPRGHTADFQTIEWIYRNQPAGSSRLGPLLDRCFLNLPVTQAIRNRPGMLVHEIMKVVESKNRGAVRVTGIGSGPADEVFEVYEQLDDPSSLFFTLVDIDLGALAFVSEKIEAKGLNNCVKLVQESPVHLASGVRSNAGGDSVDVENQDLVYSVGLIENFNDKSVVSFLDFVQTLLTPGGTFTIGNFHKNNPNKALMDYILDWRLFHRNEDDMNSLFGSSTFNKKCTKIDFEEKGIYFFASCIK
jgi:CRP-like cAMP-binding protein